MIIDWLFYSIFVFNFIFFLVVFHNLLFAPRLRKEKVMDKELRLSILIPARNEEKNIGNIINDILNQSFQNFELLIYNDHSNDNTENIIKEFQNRDSRIKLVQSKKLPEGWLGKNFACHQLSLSASFNYFLFIDADVSLQKNAIESALHTFLKNNLNMLSVFPTQKINSIKTYLVTPLMNWLLLTFLPLKKVFTSVNNAFVAANGQFILIDKNSYNEIGGHDTFKSEVVEDMEIAKAIKRNKKKLLTALGDELIFCNMYSTFKDAFNGFSKNFFTGFKIHPILFSLLLIFIEIVFLSPTIFILFDIKFLSIIILIIASRIIISYLSKQRIIINVLLHPIQLFILYLLGINSMLVKYLGTGKWKGRRI